MSISRISFTSEQNLLNKIRSNQSAYIRTQEQQKDEVVLEKKPKNKKKWFIGIGIAAGLAGLVVLGRMCKFGTYLQKLLGGIEKASSDFTNVESKQNLLPMYSKESDAVEILEAEVVDTTRLSRKSKLRMNPIVEDAEFIEL